MRLSIHARGGVARWQAYSLRTLAEIARPGLRAVTAGLWPGLEKNGKGAGQPETLSVDVIAQTDWVLRNNGSAGTTTAAGLGKARRLYECLVHMTGRGQ